MKNSIVVASRGRNHDNPSDRKTKSNGTFVQMLEPLGGGGGQDKHPINRRQGQLDFDL